MLNDNTKAKNNAQQQTRIVVQNRIALNAETPIPIKYGGNSFATTSGRKYIPFIGDDNFPSLLLEARLISPTHDGCISSIAKATVGNGVRVTNEENLNKDLFEWMKSVNEDEDSFDDIIEQVIDGERAFGTQFIEITRVEFNGKKGLKIHLHSLLRCRFQENDNKPPTHVIVSKIFERNGYVSSRNMNTARVIPLWSKNELDKKNCWARNKDGSYSTMIVFKNKKTGVEPYGLPASISSLRHQVLEGQAAQYNIDNFENNMILGGMLILKAAMSDAEAQKTAGNIIVSHTGAGKQGRVAVVSSENGLDDVKFEKYQTTQEGSFIESDKRNEEKIILSHGWNRAFIGGSQTSTLGNSGEYIRQAWDTAEAIMLNPLRRKVVDKVITPIMKIYTDWFEAKEILNYEFWFNSAKPFSVINSLKPESYMQVNEARDMAGLTKDDTVEGVYLSQLNKGNVQDQSVAGKGADNN